MLAMITDLTQAGRGGSAAQDERSRRWNVTKPAAKLQLQEIFDKDFYFAKAADVYKLA